MAEKIIKVRLFTWFEETDSPVHPGETVLTERIATMGQEVDITNEAYVKRGEDLDAFYTDEEAEEIRNGTYQGYDADLLYGARSGGLAGAPVIEPAEGEHGDAESMDAAELGQYIKEQNLTVPQTVSLIPADADEGALQKFEDAENIATDNEPRSGVISAIDKRREALA